MTTDKALALATLHDFFRAAQDIFKLAVLIPFRYIVVGPLTWLLTRLGLYAVNPAEVLSTLETANASNRLDADKVAAVLRTLNKRHPMSVVEFVEKRCLVEQSKELVSTNITQGAPSLPPQQPVFEVNAAVMKEYLIALVKTEILKEYTDANTVYVAASSAAASSSSSAAAAAMSHRSFSRLLDEIKAAAGGDPLPSPPGSTNLAPLHVIVQNGSLTQAAPTSFWGILSRSFVFLSICIVLGTLWAIGETVARRQQAGNSISGMNQPGSNTAASAFGGGVGIGSPVGPGIVAGPGNMFAPKEYSKENIPEKSIKTFQDVKGCNEAVEELQEIVEYLKNPDKFTRLGGKLPKGVLLTGPPGTGKTLLARAVAGEAGVPFFYKAGSEFDEMFVGVGSRRVRGLFAAAKKKAPCIVFIDEVDAVGGKRTTWEASGGSRKTLNQLLTEMDGFEENSGIVVMAATNLPELLDSALTRPGRFDRQVTVSLPDVRGRCEILGLYLKDKPLSSDVSVDVLARRTPGFSGAELSNLVNEAALLAARRDAASISSDILDEARDKILMGAPRSLVQTDEARKLTAYHEGGHALVALYTPSAKPIHKATIIPRGHALGMVSQLPDKDEWSTTKQQMVAHMDVCMGGKAAEELIFGPDAVTSGATSDLKTATRMARHMVEDCGMSDKIGPVFMEDSSSVSSATRKAVDEEVHRMLKESYARVASLLKSKEGELHALASALLERETLTRRDIKELLWGAEAVANEDAEAEAAVGVGTGKGCGIAVPVSNSVVAKSK